MVENFGFFHVEGFYVSAPDAWVLVECLSAMKSVGTSLPYRNYTPISGGLVCLTTKLAHQCGRVYGGAETVVV